jgi:1-acyl-sn-glycerol-3-phosphate acyltransferase
MTRQSTGTGTRALRLLWFIAHLMRGVAVAAVVYPFIGRAARRRRLKQWSKQLLRLFSIRMRVHGAPPAEGVVLIVSNHVSWLDIFAINAVRPTRFVANSDIRRWPLIGWLCAQGDTLFIDRTRRHHTRDINATMAAAMRDGDAFAVFPEGSTTHGDVLLPFHASLLQPALSCDAKIFPAAVRYSRDDGSLCSEADYEGEKSLVQSLLQLVTQPRVHLDLHFLPPIDCAGRHRRDVADEAAERIAATLGLDAPSTRAGKARGRTA